MPTSTIGPTAATTALRWPLCLQGATLTPMARSGDPRTAKPRSASANAFSELGYHAVSMEDIAARVGISAAALYRHSQSKYDLFRDAVLGLGRQLVDATAFADGLPADFDPPQTLRALIDALIDTTIVNCTAGGLYRWEARYLHGDDQAALADQIKLVNRRLQKPLARMRPELGSRERWILSSAALSVVGSITDHRAQLSVTEILTLLAELTTAALAAELPQMPSRQSKPASKRAVTGAAGNYEVLLYQSMLLFNERGYRQTSMEDIATAVGIPTSTIYRYFAAKADILVASFRRGADHVSGDLSRILAGTTDSEHALAKLVAAYVDRSFDHPEVAYV